MVPISIFEVFSFPVGFHNKLTQGTKEGRNQIPAGPRPVHIRLLSINRFNYHPFYWPAPIITHFRLRIRVLFATIINISL